jgi:hypothetical protein
MPLVKARTRWKQGVRHITRLDRETNEILYAYAHLLGEPTEYVLNHLVDTMLGKDKEFLAWRAQHADSYGPRKHPRGHARSPDARETICGNTRACSCRRVKGRGTPSRAGNWQTTPNAE